MKKSLTAIFSLSLLLSVASPVFAADQKKTTRDRICCDKAATRRLVNAGLIATLAFAAKPVVEEVLKNALFEAPAKWVADTVPGLDSDRLVKFCAVLAAAAGGSWIIKENKNAQNKKKAVLFYKDFVNLQVVQPGVRQHHISLASYQ